MAVNYGGRLGRIIKRYPKPKCGSCGSFQVQLVNYLHGDPKYRCRHCKNEFSKPFSD